MAKALKTEQRIRDVRLCTDEDGYEAMYVDGKLRTAFATIYSIELAELVGRGPVTLRHHNVIGEIGEDKEWPKRFSDLKLQKKGDPR